jgi:gag-polypeptide of LTR copia-type
MATIDNERSSTTQIEKLTEKNYRSWATTIRAILREKKLFDVVDGQIAAPVQPVDTASTEEHAAYDAALEAYEKKAFPACCILLSAISSRLITYVEDEDDPAKIWTTLKDRFRPTTDITMAQALKNIISMRMAEDDDMEAHIRNFTAGKRRLEEHGVSLEDIVYRTIFLLSMPAGYQMIVIALEGQTDMRLEAIQNRLLDEYRKRKNSPQNGMVMSALLTNQNSRKGRSRGRNSGSSHQNPGNSRNNLHCAHCKKSGHVESTCWSLHPELRRNGKPSIKDSANVAFHTSSDVISRASIKAEVRIGEKCDPNHWILDSGASEHFSPYRQLYNSYVPLREAVNIYTAKGELRGIGIGHIDIMVEDGRGSALRITLMNVLHVPDMDVNLLSTNVLLANGAEINMHPQRGTKIIKDGRVVATTIPYGKLSRLRTIDKLDVNDAISALKTTKLIQLPYDTWHRRLAHLGPWNVKKAEQLAKGIAIDPTTFPSRTTTNAKRAFKGDKQCITATRQCDDAQYLATLSTATFADGSHRIPLGTRATSSSLSTTRQG